MAWPRFSALQLWLSVLFVVYCAVGEWVRVLGRRKVMEMFFGLPLASRF